jgi:hypothetical protein
MDLILLLFGLAVLPWASLLLAPVGLQLCQEYIRYLHDLDRRKPLFPVVCEGCGWRARTHKMPIVCPWCGQGNIHKSL